MIFKELMEKKLAEVQVGMKYQEDFSVKYKDENEKERFIVPKSLRALLLNFNHLVRLVGHPRKHRMMYKLRQTCYCINLAAEVSSNAINCTMCANNCIFLQRCTKSQSSTGIRAI